LDQVVPPNLLCPGYHSSLLHLSPPLTIIQLVAWKFVSNGLPPSSTVVRWWQYSYLVYPLIHHS